MPTWYYAAVSHITTVVILATIHLKYSCAPTKEAFQLRREESFAALFYFRARKLSAQRPVSEHPKDPLQAIHQYMI